MACGGTYFHSPAVVEADRGQERSLYAVLRVSGETVGLAVVCPRSCRLSLRARHASLPTHPAVAPGREDLDPAGLLDRLAERLERRGIRELDVGSYGAPAGARTPPGWTTGDERLEYRVPLAGGLDGIEERLSSHHGRYVKQGENADYSLRARHDAEALRPLERVLSQAAARSRQEGDGFSPPTLPDPAVLREPSAGGWGGTVYTAVDGDRLLSTAYVGWAGRKAFYVSGGSTQAGYDGKAAFWMHPALMADLARRGFEEYNLGGTPAAAREQGHEQHGLFRFKSGFGPERVTCRGGTRRTEGVHLALHRGARRLSAALSGGEAATDE